MHQDHGNSFETCKSAIELGFTCVMMDGSLKEDGKTPTTFEENVEVTRKVVDFAHERGVTVEGEIGVLGGVEDGHGAGGTGLEHITDPDQAVEFAERTGVDALAIAIGTSHGAYKFTKKPDGSVLKMDVLIEIHKRLPHTHLVMHGSSSVPKDLQDVVNQYGGKLKQTWGVPVEEIQLGIKNGVRKINVDTDNRLAITGAIRKVLWETPEKFDPRDYMKPARDAMKKVVAERMTEFGQAGHGQTTAPSPSPRWPRATPAASSTRVHRWPALANPTQTHLEPEGRSANARRPFPLHPLETWPDSWPFQQTSKQPERPMIPDAQESTATPSPSQAPGPCTATGKASSRARAGPAVADASPSRATAPCA